MNKSTTLRAEEARRQALAASLEAQQRQAQMLEERALSFASETRKVFDLRAQRLARIGIAAEADASGSSVRPAAKRRRVTA